MTMPEAAVNKNNGVVFGKHDVGFSGELPVVRGVDGESVAHLMQQRPDADFRFGVLVSNPAHVPRAAFGLEVIGHGW